MKKQISNLRTKLILIQIASFILSAAPLLIYIFCHWEEYIKTPYDTVKISVGLFIGIIFLILKIIGKLKMPRRVITYSVFLIISYLLYPLIQDIVLLSAMCLIGELADLLLCQRPIKLLKEKILITKTADATTIKVKEEVKSLFDEYMGGRS